MGLGQNLLDTPTLRSGAYVRPRGAWAANTAYLVDDQVTADNAVWNCTTAHTSGATFTGTDWVLAAPVSLTQTITTSQNVTAPIWATIANVTLIAGGGGGGGGGSANSSTATPVGISNQPGGAGGGVGVEVNATLVISAGDTYSITLGAGGPGGAGGSAAAAGAAGNPGAGGNTGGTSTLEQGATTLMSVTGGYGGDGSSANSTTTTYGGLPGNAVDAQDAISIYPGMGGNSSSINANDPKGSVFPGWAALPASATVGGNALQPSSIPGTQNYTAELSSSNANGVSAPNSTLPGYGGNGGGGGAPGGAGGNGGNGGPGVCIIEWRSQ